ncbi:MAG: formate dehydrogenase accessory protein FdhE [Burkholderiaceae bacterium]
MTTVRVSSPEDIAARAGGDVPFLRWPERATLFAEREMRLRQLAAGHAMRDYLILMADLAHEQQRVLARGLDSALPAERELRAAAAAGVPPLPAADWPRPPQWRAVLRELLPALRARASGAAADTLDRLGAADDAWLEQQADRLLHGVMLGLDLGAAPFVAAALQVVWTDLVLRTRSAFAALNPSAFGRIDDKSVCPACGSRPTASVVRMDAPHAGQRYLHCSLCATQWHRLRIQCARCGKEEHIHYQSLQPQPGPSRSPSGAAEGAVRAECCDDCGHYLKIVHMDKDAHAEPVADDLASLTLDLLVAETGQQRHGVNLLLLFGESDAEPPPPPGGP